MLLSLMLIFCLSYSSSLHFDSYFAVAVVVAVVAVVIAIACCCMFVVFYHRCLLASLLLALNFWFCSCLFLRYSYSGIIV